MNKRIFLIIPIIVVILFITVIYILVKSMYPQEVDDEDIVESDNELNRYIKDNIL